MTVHDGSAALLDHVEPATVMAGAPFPSIQTTKTQTVQPSRGFETNAKTKKKGKGKRRGRRRKREKGKRKRKERTAPPT
jgi:hypothetical protein